MPYQKCEEGYEDKCKETPKKVNYICFISQKIFFCHRVCWVLIDWMTPFSRLVRRWRSIVVSGQRERSMTTPPASILIMMLILIMILIRILMTFPAYPDDNLTPWSWSMMIPPADLDPDKKSCWPRSWSWWQHLLTKILILILVHDATSCWSKSWSWSQWSRFKYWSDLIQILVWSDPYQKQLNKKIRIKLLFQDLCCLAHQIYQLSICDPYYLLVLCWLAFVEI